MSVYDYEVKTIRGEKKTLAEYRGQVLLIVNTATKCGFAPQFKGLQQLHDEYGAQGFAVLGFPCGQFANQEEEGDEAIAQACELNFGVSFPLFAKIDVKGDEAHPLFKYLSDKARGVLGSKSIKWNFTKFLIDREGNVLKRFGPNETPEKIENEIIQLLTESARV
ncbi:MULTISPECIES: glutathione peroxidase [Paenibacillus]|uniref:Glutathione peroxidase n=1 Tax=Paenibacillus vini TaxID=1476024 RepID=A0ABQ4MIN6_9BACL|nr:MULTISPECIES: glutathione peroxidase [Paenibacillus]MBQ4901869.1 glutathione peroxidase [Paenibacillus sp. Marseille-P2973]MDN4070929.1 glutathione peroxidase [Paenibacillus vini]GIP55809.1 glutathione peroxidase [Paenibacillus vini]